MNAPEETDAELALRLYEAWNEGRGVSKSQLERETWSDGSSHGRRFDRFVHQHLGVSTSKRSKQTTRIEDLERQIRSAGFHPVGTTPTSHETQVQHARAACLSAVRIWNDPDGTFRTGAFALLLVVAWNSLALAVLQRDGVEWRKTKNGKPIIRNGSEQTLDTADLVQTAFGGGADRGTRENIRFWLDLRNAVAHRQLPELDVSVIPYAQAGLLNFERKLESEFGEEYQLAEQLAVPLQLSGFRDPEALRSRKRALAALPLDVQLILGRAAEEAPELLSDETFVMRIAFVPVVPPSGRNPDAVAYFMRPGEVPDELAESLDRYVILPKVYRGSRPTMGASEVVTEVGRRIPYRFNTTNHAAVARFLGVRPPRGQPDRSLDEAYCEYVTAAKIYVYNQRWIDRVVEQVSSPEGYREATGKEPVLRTDLGAPE